MRLILNNGIEVGFFFKQTDFLNYFQVRFGVTFLILLEYETARGEVCSSKV